MGPRNSQHSKKRPRLHHSCGSGKETKREMQGSTTNKQPEINHILIPQVDLHEGSTDEKDRQELVMKVGTMDVLSPGDYTSCPIAMDEFNKASVENLHEGACFVEGKPEFCVATLPCGHRFHALSILYHMVINGMKCPVCR